MSPDRPMATVFFAFVINVLDSRYVTRPKKYMDVSRSLDPIVLQMIQQDMPAVVPDREILASRREIDRCDVAEWSARCRPICESGE